MYGYWNIPDSKVHGANMANMLAPWTLLSGIICLTGKWRVDNCQKHDAPYITLKSMYCRFHRLCMDIEISQIARFMGPTWPTCWPHEPCYQGSYVWRGSDNTSKYGVKMLPTPHLTCLPPLKAINFGHWPHEYFYVTLIDIPIFTWTHINRFDSPTEYIIQCVDYSDSLVRHSEFPKHENLLLYD